MEGDVVDGITTFHGLGPQALDRGRRVAVLVLFQAEQDLLYMLFIVGPASVARRAQHQPQCHANQQAAVQVPHGQRLVQ